MAFNDEDVKQINAKLDDINKKVTASEPSLVARIVSKWKYFVISGAWLFGAITHKWGFFHMIGRLVGLTD